MTPRHEMPTPGAAAEIAACFRALVPVLTTRRLTLRGPRLGDFPAFAAIFCSARGRHMGGPMSRADAWGAFTGFCAGWMLHGHGGWTVTDRKTGRVQGFTLLGLEPGDREVELGFFLTETAEGRGIAFEAATATRAWAAGELKLDGLVSYIDPENTRSIRLAERLGAVRDQMAEAAFDEPIRVYRHRSEKATTQ